MPVWTPDLVVTEELARRLLQQFPALEVRSLRPFAAGWDNAVWVVNDRWAFRFPQRAIAIPGVQRELAVLPALAPLLPLAVPVPVFVGRPEGAYPWPFFGSELLPGREACDVPLDDPTRVDLMLELARFLRALHGIQLDAELPLDPNRRATPHRPQLARDQLRELDRAGLWRVPAGTERLLAAAELLPPPPAPVLVHGDLHVRHVLVDSGRVAAVIDWGDVCRADRSVDLSLVWSFLPPDARASFLAAYGPVEDHQLLRARVLALSLSAALALYGHDQGLAALEGEALAGLARTLVD